MALAIATRMAEQRAGLLRFERALSLTARILAINILVITLLAGGFLYLDSYRSRLVEERQLQMAHDTHMIALAIGAADAQQRDALVTGFAATLTARVRLYDRSGTRVADSFALAPPTYRLADPDRQGWSRSAARQIDRMLDFAVRARSPGLFREPRDDRASHWPELVASLARPGVAITRYRFAPDRTPVISGGLTPGGGQYAILLTTNARDITETVRAERLRLALALTVVTMMSVLLSLFLARTIVRPLRRLAGAATRVRLGRAREVVVPRLPSRRDEIGQLARALSDMTQALRARIDAGEHMAADIAHELKNPIASLRSALEGLRTISDATLRDRLLGIADDDVHRLDRLITDISEISRVDAELSRSHFSLIDLAQLIAPIIDARQARSQPNDPRIALHRPTTPALVYGDGIRLARVIENLIDNALSFSPADGLVTISITARSGTVDVRVEDDGPGVADDQRAIIFHRFHSLRPDEHGFGQHSGLGLAIARTIVEAHDGSITAITRPDGRQGACFMLMLPLATSAGA